MVPLLRPPSCRPCGVTHASLDGSGRGRVLGRAHRGHNCGSRRGVVTRCQLDDKEPPAVVDAEQRMEQLERQLGKQFDPASRPRPAPGPTSRGAPAKVKLEPWSKRLEGKEPMEAAWLLWTGEEGVLWWANKIAYAMVFVVIAGWIVFRFVGPATGLYTLKQNLEDIPGVLEAMNALLHVKTLAELLQAKHDAVGERVSQVVTLEHTQTVGDALITLQRHGVLAAPLLVFPTLRGILGEGLADDEEASFERPTFLGMVDVLDIVSCLLAALPPLLGASRKQWESALERAAPEFLSRRLITLHARNDGALVFSAHAQITLMDVIRDGFLGGTLQVHLSGRKVSHRVAVFDSLGRVTDIASQSDVIRFLAVTPHAMGVLGNATLDQLHMGHARDGGVAQVTRSVPTVEALMFMTSRGVSSVAVVDDSGCLWGNLSASDLRGIAGSDLQLLARPVEEFLSMSIPRRGGALVTVTADSTLRTAVCRLAASHVHRVYMVDKAGRPVGIITCTDVLAALLQGDQLEGASVIAARMVVGAPRPVHRGPV